MMKENEDPNCHPGESRQRASAASRSANKERKSHTFPVFTRLYIIKKSVTAGHG